MRCSTKLQTIENFNRQSKRKTEETYIAIETCRIIVRGIFGEEIQNEMFVYM